MDRLRIGGVGLTTVGLLGYLVGITRAYPGRAFSIAAVMLGVTLLGIYRLETAEARR